MFPLEFAGKEYSDQTAQVIDSEIKAIIQQAYNKTRSLLEGNRDKFLALAHALLKYETLDAEEVKLILEGRKLDKPTMDDLLEAEHAKVSKSARSSAKGAAVPEHPAGTVPEPG
jgi:cell division protease FtsH